MTFKISIQKIIFILFSLPAIFCLGLTLHPGSVHGQPTKSAKQESSKIVQSEYQNPSVKSIKRLEGRIVIIVTDYLDTMPVDGFKDDQALYESVLSDPKPPQFREKLEYFLQTDDGKLIKIKDIEKMDMSSSLRQLQTSTGTSGQLISQKNAERLSSATRVRLTDTMLETIPISKDRYAYQASSGHLKILETSPTATTQAHSSPTRMDEQHVAIVLVNFQDDNTRPWTKPEMENMYFLHADSASNYFEAISYGETTLTGEIFDNNGQYYTLPINKIRNSTECNMIAQLAVDAIDPEIDFFENGIQKFDRIDFHFPHGDCGYGVAGKASLNPVLIKTADGDIRVKLIWINGTYGFNRDKRKIKHEHGHNFGLLHANSWQCSDGRNCSACYKDSLNPDCPIISYGNMNDVMGLGFGHFNALHKIRTGWLKPTNVQRVIMSGLYRIHALEQPSEDIQALSVLDYVIEYRSDTQSVNINFPCLQEVCITPESIDVRAGEHYFDPTNNILIKPIRGDNHSMDVLVDFDTLYPHIKILSPNNGDFIGSQEALIRFQTNQSGLLTIYDNGQKIFENTLDRSMQEGLFSYQNASLGRHLLRFVFTNETGYSEKAIEIIANNHNAPDIRIRDHSTSAGDLTIDYSTNLYGVHTYYLDGEQIGAEAYLSASAFNTPHQYTFRNVPSGEHQFTIELSEGPNGRTDRDSVNYTIVDTNLPDLTVTPHNWPTDIQDGSNALFSWTTHNTNSSPIITPFEDGIYVDNIKRGSTTWPLFTQSGNTGLNLGNLGCGPHNVYVKTDDLNSITESDENNNTTPLHTITVHCDPNPQEPDLHIQSDNWPTEIQQGQTAAFSWTTTNMGSGDTGEYFYDYLYVDNQLTNSTLWANLPGHQSRSSAMGVTNLDCGTHEAYMTTDGGNAINESNENNNVTPTHTFTVNCSTDIDLTVTADNWPSTATEGQTRRLYFTTHNIGASASGSFNTRVYVDNTHINRSHFTNLVPGASHQNWTYWTPICGTHTIFAMADADHNVNETNENNNQTPPHTVTVDCAPSAMPDLTVQKQNWPTTVDAGTQVGFVVRIDNTGNAQAGSPFDTQLYIDNQPVGPKHTLHYFPAGGYDFTGFNWTATCGTHTVEVRTDTDNVVTESNENNNITSHHTINVTQGCGN